MRWLGRLVLVPLALLFAIPAGAVALLVAALLDPILGALGADLAGSAIPALVDALIDLQGPEALAAPARRIRDLALMLLVAPPAFVGLAGEIAGLRSFLWYAGATGALAAAIPWISRTATRAATIEELHITAILFLAGATAGAVYWLIAGSSAGRRRSADAAFGRAGPGRSGAATPP